MKIKIEADGHRFTIPLPTGVVLNGITTKIISSELKKHSDIPLTEEQLKVLIKELKRAKKTFPKLPLVDVQTADGEKVLITL